MADCIKLFEYFIDDFVIKQKLCLFGTSDDSANVDLPNLIKIVKKAFVDNINDSKDASFDEKLSAQFSNIHDDNVKNQGKLTQIDVVGKFRMDKEDSGIGGANPRLQKYDEIKYLILLMEKLVGLKLGQVDDVKLKIFELIIGNEIDSANLPIKNALLHLCDPIHFEPIFSHSHKN